MDIPMDWTPSNSITDNSTHSYNRPKLREKRRIPLLSPEENRFSFYAQLSNLEAQRNQLSPYLGQERNNQSCLSSIPMDWTPSNSNTDNPTHSYNRPKLRAKRRIPLLSPEENRFSFYAQLSNLETQRNQLSPNLGQERNHQSYLSVAGSQERILQVGMDVSGQQNRIQQLQLNLPRQTDRNIVSQSNWRRFDRFQDICLKLIRIEERVWQRTHQQLQNRHPLDEIPSGHIPVRHPSAEQAERNNQLQLNFEEILLRITRQQPIPQTTHLQLQNHQPEASIGQNPFRLSTEEIAGISNQPLLDFQELSITSNRQQYFQGHARANEQLLNTHSFNRPIGFRHPTEAVAEEDLDDIKCVICLMTVREYQQNRRPLTKTICGHYFCNPCIDEWIKTSPNCPICRQLIRYVI